MRLLKLRVSKTLIDGAHGVGMLDLDVKDLGCDMYASCCHKWMLGPKGTGVLYANKDLIEELDALFVGGYSDTGWLISEEKSEITGLRADSHRFFYGTQNTRLIRRHKCRCRLFTIHSDTEGRRTNFRVESNAFRRLTWQ